MSNTVWTVAWSYRGLDRVTKFMFSYMGHPWLKGTRGRNFFCHPWLTLFRKSVSSKEVFYRRLLVWKNCIRGANKVPSNRKKSWFFFGADWPATSMPSGWSMVPLGAQRTHMCRQRCAITNSHTRDHCGCTTTVRRATLVSYRNPLVNHLLFPIY